MVVRRKTGVELMSSGDRLKGGSGDDVLAGDEGSDVAKGHGGSDACSAETVSGCESGPADPLTVIAYSFGYNPTNAIVPLGNTVHFTVPAGIHTVTWSTVPAGASPSDCGGDCDVTFSVAGIYHYFCAIHGAALMSGSLVVEP